MFENLTTRLSKMVKNLRGQSRLSIDNIQHALREVRIALLEADVALPVIKDFIESVKNQAQGEEVIGSLTPGQAVIGIVHQALVHLMGEENAALNLATRPPAVILMAGLQGAGKTTTTAKLAQFLTEKQKKKVLVVSTDIYRPAAIEQLEILAKQIGISHFASDPSQKPIEIANRVLDYAKRHFYDALIVDTAGRLGIDAVMMNEIQTLYETLQPIETLFVVDAMQGQDAVNTAKAFNETLPLTGIILTKLDGDARGGAALSVRHVTGKPIKFTGTGEKLNALEPFYPDRLASRILGMGDVLTLIEEVQQSVDQKEAERIAKKMESGKGFNLEDFKCQLLQMKKMGGISTLMDKLPTQLSSPHLTKNGDAAEKTMKQAEGIINAMTPLERQNPALIKASRKRRIAKGAGVQIQAVNKLLAQFEQIQKTLKHIKGGGVGGMAKLMRSLGGRFAGPR